MSGELLALVSALLWAIASVLLTMGAKTLPVVPLNFVRCVVSSAFFWVMLPFFGGPQALAEITPRNWLWIVVSVVALLVVGDTLYFRSMALAGVSWAMPVASINPLWAVLLAALFVGEPLSWSLLGGAVLVVAGIILVSRSARTPDADDPVGGDPAAGNARRRGLLLAAVVSLLWAAGQVALKLATEGLSSVVANSVRQPLGMFMLLALTLVRGQWRALRGLDRKSWLVILAASFLGTGIGSLLFVTAIQLAGAGRTAVLTSTTPAMAIPFSVLWLGERPTRWTVAGTLLTVIGIALVV